jgi:hypothetical protein
VTVRADMSITTTASPKAPVLMPLVVCVASPAPVRFAVSVKVCADAGTAASPASATVATSAKAQRDLIHPP